MPRRLDTSRWKGVSVLVTILLSLFLNGLAFAKAQGGTAQPFEVSVSDDVLHDLKSRLAETRWPDQVKGAGWTYGTNRAYLEELVSYWQNGFDWRAL